MADGAAATSLPKAARLFGSEAGGALSRAAIWSAVGEAMSRGLIMIALLITARFLGPESYGALGLIRTTVATFATLGGIGLGLTANRFVAEYRTREKAKAADMIALTYLAALIAGSLVAGGAAIAADPLSLRLLGHPELTPAIRISAFLMLLGALNGAQVGVLQGLHAYRRLAVANAGQGLIGLSALPVGAYLAGFDGALAGLVLYTVSGAVLYQLAVRKERIAAAIPIARWSFRDSLPLLWRFTVPAALMGVATAPARWFCEADLARAAGLTQLGLFHAAFLVVNVVVALVSTLNAPLISAASDGDVMSRRSTYLTLYGTWYAFLVIGLPVICLPRLVLLPFGSEYAAPQLASILVLLIGYAGLLLYYQGVVRIVAYTGSMWWTLLTNLVEGAVLLVVFLLIPERSAMSLSISYLCSYAARLVVSIPILRRQKLLDRSVWFDTPFVLSFVGFYGLLSLILIGLPWD